MSRFIAAVSSDEEEDEENGLATSLKKKTGEEEEDHTTVLVKQSKKYGDISGLVASVVGNLGGPPPLRIAGKEKSKLTELYTTGSRSASMTRPDVPSLIVQPHIGLPIRVPSPPIASLPALIPVITLPVPVPPPVSNGGNNDDPINNGGGAGIRTSTHDEHNPKRARQEPPPQLPIIVETNQHAQVSLHLPRPPPSLPPNLLINHQQPSPSPSPPPHPTDDDDNAALELLDSFDPTTSPTFQPATQLNITSAPFRLTEYCQQRNISYQYKDDDRTGHHKHDRCTVEVKANKIITAHSDMDLLPTWTKPTKPGKWKSKQEHACAAALDIVMGAFPPAITPPSVDLVPATPTPPPPPTTFSLVPLLRPPLCQEVLVKLKPILLSQPSFTIELEPANQDAAQRLLQKYGISISNSSLQAMRHCMLPNLVPSSFSQLLTTPGMMTAVLESYLNDVSIVDIARQHRVPPTILLRELIKFRDKDTASDNSIKAFISGKRACGASWVTTRDLSQRDLALDHDGTTFQHVVALGQSETFKQQVKELLQRHNIGFAYPTKRNGTAMPDFLIQSNLTIDGQPCQWIVCKDYWGGVGGYFDSSNKSQVKKFAAQFGRGAIFFSQGVSISLLHGLESDNVAVVDIEWIGE